MDRKGILFLMGVLVGFGFPFACATIPKSSSVKLGRPAVATRAHHLSVHFDFNQDVVTEKERSLLEENREWLEQNPRAVLLLGGHTDAIGTPNYNFILGDYRARSVKGYLASYGIDPRRLIVLSYGETQPLEPNDTHEGRASNRRVAFVLR